jgi:hypothetical protein
LNCRCLSPSHCTSASSSSSSLTKILPSSLAIPHHNSIPAISPNRQLSTRRAPGRLSPYAFLDPPFTAAVPGAFRLKVAKAPCSLTAGIKPCAGQACEICIVQDCQRACRGCGCVSKTQPNLFQKTKTRVPRKGSDTHCPSFWPFAIFEPCSKPCKSTQHRHRRTVCCSRHSLSPVAHICQDSKFQGKF